jgi:hypothetical protein
VYAAGTIVTWHVLESWRILGWKVTKTGVILRALGWPVYSVAGIDTVNRWADVLLKRSRELLKKAREVKR